MYPVIDPAKVILYIYYRGFFMSDISLDTPKLIKNKRETFGLTQKDFSELLGLNDTGERTVSGWERGEHIPTPSKLKEINELTVKVPFKDTSKNNKSEICGCPVNL